MKEITANWKLHGFVLILVVIAELVGIRSFKIGPGTALFLPMLYALVMGVLLGPKFLKVVTTDEMKKASPLIGISVMLLMARYSTLIGPSVPHILWNSPGVRPAT